MSQLDILLLVLKVLFAAIVPLCFIAIGVWMERRGAAFIQDRSGPNRAAVFGFRAGGLIQNLADGIKLAFKEDMIPGHVKHKFYFVLAPIIVMSVAIISFATVPFADALVINGKTYLMQGIPTDLGILWFLALAGFAVYGTIMAGWSSHDKYSKLGGLRAAAQVISYEIPMGLAIIGVLIVYGTVSLTEIAQFQGKLLFGIIPMWGIVVQPLGAVIFIVAAFAEANRTPFCVVEGESEIVGSFHTEYSAMKFAVFFMGEYVAMFVSSAIIVTLFFGGFQIPWFSTETIINHARFITLILIIALPVLMQIFAMWISKNNRSQYERANDPRVWEAQIYIKGLWGIVALIEIILIVYLIAVSGGGGTADRILTACLQIITFLIKTTLMCFVYVWVRWTLPRFRYDQVQKLGWQVLLPLSLLNILITSAVVVALN